MRLVEMAQALVDGRPKRGLGMEVTIDGDVTKLSYQYGDRLPIAEISNRKGKSYTLTIYTESNYRYYCVSHCNRLSAVFRAIAGDHWSNVRYSSFQRWGYVKIWDTKIHIEISPMGRPVTFTVVGDKASFNYKEYEQAHMEGEEKPVEKKPELELPTVNDCSSEIKDLMAMVASI